MRAAVVARDIALAAWTSIVAVSCSFDRGDRWLKATPQTDPKPLCDIGDLRCAGDVQRCTEGPDGATWETIDECVDRDLICVPDRFECLRCVPGRTSCNGRDVERCSDDGDSSEFERTCDDEGTSCRTGSCVNLCEQARAQRSNVGCEYWAADLDNANIDASTNAAAQQFAVVVSNPQPDVPASVRIALDNTEPDEANDPTEIVRATIPPLSLEVFKLGPREVDGSPPGEFDTGTHTALTRHAYEIRTSVPVVAYQFNPLENVDVFSNDASLLKPVEALAGRVGTVEDSYVVMGWPQTIASTDDPNTNFSSQNPRDLRAFLTIVATRPETKVRLQSTTRFLGASSVPAAEPGRSEEYELNPFDVLNLETDDFNADFTGSVVAANQPIVVFSGSEASDAPFFENLSDRACCADHLEEQLDPIRTSGKRFVATVSPNRARAVTAAGVDIGEAAAPEFFRILAATTAGARVSTTLAEPDDAIRIEERGGFVDIVATEAFLVESDEPVVLASVSPSQDAAGVPSGLPGGDPSFLIVPPIEQFRRDYVFLTPDRYSFDFVRIVAAPDAEVRLDGTSVRKLDACRRNDVKGFDGSKTAFLVYECQLSFPVLDAAAASDTPLGAGIQNDGVHEVVASADVGVLVDGFDRNVSYAYAAGTDLVEIVAR